MASNLTTSSFDNKQQVLKNKSLQDVCHSQLELSLPENETEPPVVHLTKAYLSYRVFYTDLVQTHKRKMPPRGAYETSTKVSVAA